MLLRQCTHVLRNGHDAEEAVQSALLKAYRAFSRGRRPESVLPWLVTIARNECFDMIRARRRTEELPLEVASDEIRPDDLIVQREDARALRADIAELPEAQRTALVLRVIGDLPHAEIAERLGGTPADARTLCHEARLSLAEFEEGRALACSAVLERIETGDGRALRARRIRAHLRACEGCRTAAEGIRAPRRSRLGGLFPFPSLAALRALLAGGGPIGGPSLTGGAIAVVAARWSWWACPRPRAMRPRPPVRPQSPRRPRRRRPPERRRPRRARVGDPGLVGAAHAAAITRRRTVVARSRARARLSTNDTDRVYVGGRHGPDPGGAGPGGGGHRAGP